MRIGVVIPTVGGREAEYETCRTAYRQLSPASTHIIGQRGFGSCGAAWASGAEWCLRNGADAIHFTADDLIPHRGWYEEALGLLEMGIAPAPVLVETDGRVWNTHEPAGSLVAFPRVPFVLREWWDAMPPMLHIHYQSDCWVGDRLAEQGIRMLVCDSYRFTHTWAQPSRKDVANPQDALLYERSRR
jgi:hypothetical protein